MKTTIATLLLAGILLLTNFSGKPPREPKSISISFSGAFALYPLVQSWAAAYNKIHPDIRFDIQAGGAGKGLTDCLSGAVDVGMFSRELSPEEKAKGVWWIALCKDAVLPTMNAKNSSLKKPANKRRKKR